MRVYLIAAFAAFGLAGAASANEIEEGCRAYAAETGGDASGCACIGEKAAADPALAEALMAIDSPEALEAADESVRGAIAACWMPADSAEG